MALSETEKKSDKKEKPLTKVIIRRLPPSIDQDTFIKQISPIPDYSYIYTVNGDFNLGENAFSRVYINFVHHEDVYNFKERFDNYVFLDAKGSEFPCVVEFAPFQKIPKKRGKSRMDPKAGSIESDPYYLDFLENLQKPQEVDEKPEYTLQLTSSNENKNDITTPLLEYIKSKRAQRMRIREVRREERKRREFDKRRDHFDDRDRDRDKKKVSEEKSPIKKSHSKTENPKSEKTELEATVVEKSEKEERYYEKSYYKNKDRRYDDRRFEDRRKEPKPRYPRKEYSDYKNDDRKEKKYEYSKKDHEPKAYPKKVKKYSEKREERKLEAQKAEQKKVDDAKVEEKKTDDGNNKNAEQSSTSNKASEKVSKLETPTKAKKDDQGRPCQDNTNAKDERDNKKKERESTYENDDDHKSDSHNQRRIRNKDRPTIAIYRPGMLSKRKQNDGDTTESKEKLDEK